MRRWVDAHTDVVAATARAPPDPPRTRAELFDRYTQHAEHCVHCADALRAIDAWRPRARVALALCALLAARSGLARGGAALGVLAMALMGAVERELRTGGYEHHRSS